MEKCNHVQLNVLIVGHTKNVCDGAFGHVKRPLCKKDIKFPHEMMSLIYASIKSTKYISSLEVDWKNWKDFLSSFFMSPSAFRIMDYHLFEADKSYFGSIGCKKYVDEEEVTTYSFLNNGVTPQCIRDESKQMLSSFNRSLSKLKEVPSAQQQNRKNYLFHNVVNRYFENDSDFISNYFIHVSNFREVRESQ